MGDDLFNLIQVLLNRGNVDVNREDSQGLSAISALCLCYQGKRLTEIIRLLIEHGSSASSAVYSLCKYRKHGLLDAVRAFIDRGGCEVDAKASDGSTALLALCAHQHDHPDFMTVLRLLVDCGANVDSRDGQGRNTLLIICAEHLSDDLVDKIKFLIENQVDVNARDVNGTKAVNLLNRRGFSKSSEVVLLLRS